MATRTPKAAKKAAAKSPPKASKEPKAPKGPKPGAGRKAPAKKARKPGRKQGLAFEETQDAGAGWPEALDTVRAKQPSFFERLRQRRAEKAEARAEEKRRRDAERREAEERARWAREEQEKLRLAQEEEERARQAEDERKMKAALKRAEARAAKEEAARLEAEAKAAEEEAAKESARLRREHQKAQREQAAAMEAEAEREAQERRAAERQRKREELEAEERRLAEEQAARDAEEEVEARRRAVTERLKAEAEAAEAARAAQAKELEPDLEFEEASKPVQESDALVPAKGGATAADAQADLVAAELAKRRSKPIVVIGDIPEPPRLPKAPLRPGEQEVTLPAPGAATAVVTDEPRPAPSQPTESFGFSLPEAFLLLANGGGWDERAEQDREGAFGGALAGAMALELLMRGQVLVQRDRLVLTGEPTDDEALAPIVERLRRVRERKGDLTSLQQMGQLAKANRDLLTPFKQRLADKGLADYGSRKHLGLFHRSWVEILDEGAQERLQNRLRRAIAGGGTPEAASILLLGLLDAAGLFDTVVPDEAADYNRKRLNGLLGGRDIMGYKVDPELKALQEVATRAILGNVRVMTVRG